MVRLSVISVRRSEWLVSQLSVFVGLAEGYLSTAVQYVFIAVGECSLGSLCW